MSPFQLTKECVTIAESTTLEAGHTPAKIPNKPLSIRVFENGFVENVFGKAHPITPIVWFGPLIAYGLYRGATSAKLSSWRVFGLFVLGWLVWTFIEYLLHRFVFHFEAETPAERLRSFMVHGYHHEFPRDRMRLVAPPLMSWPIAVVYVSSVSWLLGFEVGGPLIAGTATGYIAYDWIHYYTHHFKPANPVGRWLRTYHLHHHYQTPDARYGVSSPLWDFVFRTYQPIRKESKQQHMKVSVAE